MMKRIAIMLLVAICLGCALKRDRKTAPKFISPARELISAQLVDLGRENWLVYETNDPPKLTAILNLLLEAEVVDEATSNQQEFDMQIRLSYANGTNSSSQYGQTPGDLRLASIKKTRSFRLKMAERLNTLMRK